MSSSVKYRPNFAIVYSMSKPKILVIVGPTASGKSALAVELALRLNGEVISADSRQVYRGLDIGSGKVTKEEMKGVPHHLLDIFEPNETYTGTNFVQDANLVILDILERKKLPIVTGGTFFYIELLRGLSKSAPVAPSPLLRTELEKLSNEELFQKLQTLDLDRANNIDKHNRHRLIRSLEIIDALGKVPAIQANESPYDWKIIGIDIEKELLHERIKTRLEERLKHGMIEEVEGLLKNGITPKRLISFGLEYRYLTEYLIGKITYEQMFVEILNKSKQFAKRQLTWLKRDETMIWKKFPVNIEELETEVRDFLSK